MSTSRRMEPLRERNYKSRSPASSPYWSKTDLLVYATIGGSPLRLQIILNDKESLYATDSEGQTGLFHFTDGMADGKYVWMIIEVDRSADDSGDDATYEVRQNVTLDKRSNAAMLVQLDSWEARGEFDIVKALAFSQRRLEQGT